MPRKKHQTPMLMRSGLTDSVYIVTQYEDLGEGQFRAITKHDITKQFLAFVYAFNQEFTVKPAAAVPSPIDNAPLD